jgi:hypothetical protein
MRTIATLTMVFLPGTFVSSVFSLPITLDAGRFRSLVDMAKLCIFGK